MDLKHVCKFCKKSYPCGRSLGGHIRSHLIKNNKNNSSDGNNEKPKLSESGFEPGSELRLNPKKTSKVSTNKLNSSPSSFSTGSEPEHELDRVESNKKENNSMRRSSVDEDDDSNFVSEMEQEEVAIAMCLIMLSRDDGNDRGNLSSIDDRFSDQILLFQANNKTKRRSKREKNQAKCSVSSAAIKKKSKNLKFTPSGSSQNGSKLKGVEVSATGFAVVDHSNMPSESKNVDGKLQNGFKMKELDLLQDGVASIDRNDEFSQSKRKIGDAYEDGLGSNDRKSDNYESNFVENDMNLELFDKDFDTKRSKFECTTCNKVFNSYQALGGHRASHKRQLEVTNTLVSKLESNDISRDENVGHDRRQFVAEIGIGSSKKSNQKHECPICFRVFSSGQALGGHKRSHLLVTNGNINSETNLGDRSSSRETARDLFDLNLPPVTIEEDTTATTIATASSSNSVVEPIKPYWWVDSSNHEPFSSLIRIE